MSSNPNWLEDLRLKERCLERDETAWALLYEGNFPGLVRYSQSFLVIVPIPGLTSDDVAENVFGSLWENNCHLVRYYKPDRSPWQTFLRLLARRQIITCHRREHEFALPDGDYVDPGADRGLVEAQFHEFTAALPARLRQWLAEEVLGIADTTAPPTSQAAKRKHRERVLRMANEHFGFS